MPAWRTRRAMGDELRRPLAEMLRNFRLRAKLSQAELAERAGVSIAAVGALEQGSRRAPYRDTVDRLVEALRLSPQERSAFETAARSARSRGIAKTSAAGTSSDGPPANNIEPGDTQLIQRLEMREVYELIQTRRCVTITGAAGVGKTRTALAVAGTWIEERASEAWFCDLSSIQDATIVIVQIAASIGLDLDERGDRLRALTSALRDRAALLVIDNCEHVNDEAGRVTAAIVRDCPSITILATSRERLYLNVETVYRLPSLSEADSIALFIARAASADVRYSFTGTRPFIVADICRRLDGIPLAIELAASLVPSIGLTELATRVGETVLPTSAGVNSRQQTMSIAIDRSYALLNGEERTLLRRLSVFTGTFPLSAIEALDRERSQRKADTASLVSRFVETSLLRIHHGADGARYSFLVSIRAYCLTKLEAANECDGAESDLLRWARALVAHAREQHAALGASAFLNLMRPEMNNVRTALTIGFAKPAGDERIAALKLLETTAPAWWYMSRRAELAEVVKQGVDLFEHTGDPELAASLLLILSRVSTGRDVLIAAERALPALLNVGRTAAAALVLSNAALEYCQREEFDQARNALTRAGALAESLDAQSRLGNDYSSHLAAACETFTLLRNFDAARACVDELRVIGGRIGADRQHEALFNQMSTRIQFFSGADREHVIAACEGVVRQTADAPELAITRSIVLSNSACYRLVAGDAVRAAGDAEEALDVGAFDSYLRAETVLHLATAAAMLGQPVPAARGLGCIAAFFQRAEIRFPSLEYAESHAILVRTLEVALSVEELAQYRMHGATAGIAEMRAELSEALAYEPR